MATRDGRRRPRHSLTLLLIILVALGGLGVSLIWSGLNDLTATRALTTLGASGIVGGALMLGAVCVYLWRYLNELLSEAQRRGQSQARKDA
jgi:O-antigen ligase